MSKAAKDVVHDTLNIEMVDNYNCLSCGHHQPESLVSKALRVVAALTKAGWLRSSPYAESASEERIATLTRERDEARRTRTVEFDYRRQAEAERDAAREEAVKYRTAAEAMSALANRASAASPEVMRVLDALAEHKEWHPRNFSGPWYNPESKGSWSAIAAAYNALSASSQPKAQEPKYVVCEHYGDYPWMVCPRNSDALSKWRDKAGAEAECARLNGEGGGK